MWRILLICEYFHSTNGKVDSCTNMLYLALHPIFLNSIVPATNAKIGVWISHDAYWLFRRGPGYWLLQEGGLGMMRDILVILRLWGIPKANFITREKDLDLNSKIFTMLGKLKESPEDETLLDECLILPSQVSMKWFTDNQYVDPCSKPMYLPIFSHEVFPYVFCSYLNYARICICICMT